MAVVTGYGTGYKNPTSLKAAEAVYAEASDKNINSKVDIANGDSIASKYFIGRVPSNAILDPRSNFWYEAVTGVTTMDVGFNSGNAGAINALVAAKDISSAGNASMLSAVATASLNKRVWELAGYTTDPGGMQDLVMTINAASAAAKSVIFAATYSKLL